MMLRCAALYLLVVGKLSPAERLEAAGDGEPWPAPTENVSSLPVVEWLHGSTRPAKVEWTDPSGQVQLFVRKSSANNPDAVAVEAIVNRIYEIFGVSAPRCRVYNDNAFMLCRWLGKLQSTFSVQELLEDSRAIAELDKHYVLDAIMQHYDLAGNHGNVGQLSDGTIVRIDNGGSLSILAKGVPKHVSIDGSTPWKFRIKTWTDVPYDLWDYRRYFSWSRGSFSSWQQTTRGAELENLMPQVRDVVGKRSEVLNMIATEFPEYRTRVGNVLDARARCLDTFSNVPASGDTHALALLGSLNSRASNGDEIFEPLGSSLVEEMRRVSGNM